jgi:hypothetical protein
MGQKTDHDRRRSARSRDIEHRILRPIWRDPRIHYAVNCAALPARTFSPFTGANAELLLDRGAREHINHPRGAIATTGRRTISLSDPAPDVSRAVTPPRRPALPSQCLRWRSPPT